MIVGDRPITSESTRLSPDAILGVAAGLDLLLLSDDEVLVQFGTRSRPSELLRDNDLTGILGKVIGKLLLGSSTMKELLAEAGPAQEDNARTLLRDLIDRGILADIRSSPVEQYLRYTFDGESHRAENRIGIIGAGPLGARIANSFLQQGVGRITLLDDRRVDLTWRAFMPFEAENEADGRRADVLVSERLRVHCFDARLDAAGIEKTSAESDFIVLALEQPDLRTAHLLNRCAIRERKPWLLATIDGNLGLVGPLFHPVDTACYNDYQTLWFAATPSTTMARKHRDQILRRRAGSFFAGLPSYAEIVAGHASLAAIHFLLGISCFALGRVMVVDFDRMSIDLEDVLKLPRCPVCGTEKSAYRPPLPA